MTRKFYETLEPMECFAGDTTPYICVSVEGADPEECTAELVCSEHGYPQAATLTVPCTLETAEDGTKEFCARLTSSDTEDLTGAYRILFVLTDSTGLQHIKLAGTLNVIPAVRRST